MVVSPDDFKSHSERIEDYEDEIARRCAISRRYYYIFHLLREENNPHSQSYFNYGPGDHGEASSFIQRVGYKNLADDLDDLRDARNEADYDIDDNISDLDLATFCCDF